MEKKGRSARQDQQRRGGGANSKKTGVSDSLKFADQQGVSGAEESDKVS